MVSSLRDHCAIAANHACRQLTNSRRISNTLTEVGRDFRRGCRDRVATNGKSESIFGGVALIGAVLFGTPRTADAKLPHSVD